jgi:hypothetical protein
MDLGGRRPVTVPAGGSAGQAQRVTRDPGGQGGTMHGRRGPAALLAAGILTGIAACGHGGAAVFRPAGAVPSAPGRSALPGPGAQHLGSFRFPGDVSIDFASPAPASAAGRAVIAGYQDYVLSLWAAVLTHGKNTGYLQRAAGNAAGFVRREAARYRSPGVTVKGTISYTSTRVVGIYFGTGADVLSCVDAEAFHRVNAETGATVGSALPARLTRYLENVSEGRSNGGTWSVTRLAIYPASSTQGAMCR